MDAAQRVSSSRRPVQLRAADQPHPRALHALPHTRILCSAGAWQVSGGDADQRGRHPGPRLPQAEEVRAPAGCAVWACPAVPLASRAGRGGAAGSARACRRWRFPCVLARHAPPNFSLTHPLCVVCRPYAEGDKELIVVTVIVAADGGFKMPQARPPAGCSRSGLLQGRGRVHQRSFCLADWPPHLLTTSPPLAARTLIQPCCRSARRPACARR